MLDTGTIFQTLFISLFEAYYAGAALFYGSRQIKIVIDYARLISNQQ